MTVFGGVYISLNSSFHHFIKQISEITKIYLHFCCSYLSSKCNKSQQIYVTKRNWLKAACNMGSCNSTVKILHKQMSCSLRHTYCKVVLQPTYPHQHPLGKTTHYGQDFTPRSFSVHVKRFVDSAREFRMCFVFVCVSAVWYCDSCIMHCQGWLI